MYSGTPPYDHPVYKTTSLLRPYSFKPNVKIIESFHYFEDPVNASTSLLRPGFYGPTVVALTGFHCSHGNETYIDVQYDMISMKEDHRSYRRNFCICEKKAGKKSGLYDMICCKRKTTPYL